MNDDLSIKFSNIINAFDKAKSIAGLSNPALNAISDTNAFMDKSIYGALYSNPVLSSVDGLLKNIYFEPKTFNPIMAAFGNVSQMMEQIEIKNSYNSVGMSSIFEIFKSFSNEGAINSFAGISKMGSTLLNDINFSTFNWRENYPIYF